MPSDQAERQGSRRLASKSKFSRVQIEETADNAKFWYNMNHENRGLFYIINNKTFHPDTKLRDRPGTDADVDSLSQRFKALGFEIKVHNDVTKTKMLQLMAEGESSCSVILRTILGKRYNMCIKYIVVR